MKKLYLPSLRGIMGDWVYYPTLMKLKDIAERVKIAEEIYQTKTLSEMVQQEIKRKRGKEIKDYLLKQEQRFFNSLIVAVHEGDPNWHEITRLKSNNQLDSEDIPEDVVAGIGILSLNGEEELFTLDGQHRLMGIKEAVAEAPHLGEDELSIIFIAHRTDLDGMERTRNLFTTLNKNAVRVSKGETIALDEDNTMAITVRRLVSENSMFMENRILNNATDNIPKSNQTCLTTIGNLYDLLSVLFTKVYVISKKKTFNNRKDELTKVRQPDHILDEHYQNACDYFKRLTDSFLPLQEFVNTSDNSTVVKKYRHPEGGSVLFRPIGLQILTEIIAELVEKYPLSKCFKMISKLPTDLTQMPYNGVIWHPTQKKILTKDKTLVKNLLLYMLNHFSRDVDKLRDDYAKAIGIEIEEVELPKKVL
ncbi:hypothetical protein C6503_18175 [Candidatus Poribacteria bacterium]|nr:MAG: hypothetical protein C6503_18175 [Candidatus Poribacteria bacterium]